MVDGAINFEAIRPVPCFISSKAETKRRIQTAEQRDKKTLSALNILGKKRKRYR